MTLKLIIGVNFDTKYQILILDSEFMLVMWNRSWTCNYVCELHPKIMEYYVKYNNDYYVIKSNQFTNKTLSNRSDQIRSEHHYFFLHNNVRLCDVVDLLCCYIILCYNIPTLNTDYFSWLVTFLVKKLLIKSICFCW